VISRNTAFTYKDKPVNAKQIGRELACRHELAGEIRDRHRQPHHPSSRSRSSPRPCPRECLQAQRVAEGLGSKRTDALRLGSRNTSTCRLALRAKPVRPLTQGALRLARTRWHRLMGLNEEARERRQTIV
jgi:hypothetical protein